MDEGLREGLLRALVEQRGGYEPPATEDLGALGRIDVKTVTTTPTTGLAEARRSERPSDGRSDLVLRPSWWRSRFARGWTSADVLSALPDRAGAREDYVIEVCVGIIAAHLTFARAFERFLLAAELTGITPPRTPAAPARGSC